MNEHCIDWNGPRSSRGYGTIRTGGRWILAHRKIYEIFNGLFDPKLCILHRCDRPSCINPLHLYAGTRLDNARDRDSHGHNYSSNKTRCIRGHALSGSNLVIDGKQRKCRECCNLRRRAAFKEQ